MRGTTLHWTHNACLEADFRITLGSASAYQCRSPTFCVEGGITSAKEFLGERTAIILLWLTPPASSLEYFMNCVDPSHYFSLLNAILQMEHTRSF